MSLATIEAAADYWLPLQDNAGDSTVENTRGANGVLLSGDGETTAASRVPAETLYFPFGLDLRAGDLPASIQVDTNPSRNLFAVSGNTFGVAVWANPSGEGSILSQARWTPGAWYFRLLVDANGDLVLYSRGTATTIATGHDTGEWHHYAVTWDGTSLLVYIDGGDPITAAAGSGATATPTMLRIGAYGTSGPGGEILDGAAAGFVLAPMLTAEEIATLAARPTVASPRRPPSAARLAHANYQARNRARINARYYP